MTEVYLSPVVPGRLETLDVHEGDAVKKGQRVGTLDRFEDARRDYRRARELLGRGGSTRRQFEKAELILRDQQLIAPIDGLVLNRVSEPGETISPGIPAVVIGNPQDVYVKIFVTEREVGLVKVGQPARLAVDAFPDRFFEGRVTFISPTAEFTPKNVQTKEERVTQTFAVKVTLQRPDGTLKPGMPADCEIITRGQ